LRKVIDGKLVSLRVNGHLGPSILRGSPVVRIAPAFGVSAFVILMGMILSPGR
jgi:hypothetical protein